MPDMPKRTVSISIKLTPDEWEALSAAADRIWPGAPITRSQIVVGLAKMGADATRKRGPKGK